MEVRPESVPAAARRGPAVLVPLVDRGAESAGDLVMKAIAAAAAGADGVDLSLPDPQRALEAGLSIADELAAASGLSMYLRASVPVAAGDHRRIVDLADAASGRGDVVVDLGVDRCGAPPGSSTVAARFDAADAETFMISTAGFAQLTDPELMALATIATVRRATAVSAAEVKVVRRVVDTVAAVLAAEVQS